jgi:hypothetical protein
MDPVNYGCVTVPLLSCFVLVCMNLCDVAAEKERCSSSVRWSSIVTKQLAAHRLVGCFT